MLGIHSCMILEAIFLSTSVTIKNFFLLYIVGRKKTRFKIKINV